MNKILERKSRHLSKILRHDTEGLNIDDKGWIKVSDILNHLSISLLDLEYIVNTNNKKRFIFDNFKNKIRATQGHSNGIAIKKEFIQLKTLNSNIILYHGTDKKTAEIILNDKIISGSRNHVHWTSDIELAKKRANQKNNKTKSEPVLIILNHIEYLKNNIIYLSENNVYLTDNVDKHYLSIKYM